MNLTEHILNTLHTTTLTDPAEIAEQIINNSSPTDHAEWLPMLVARAVGDVMRTSRNAALASDAVTRPPAKNRSAKRDGIRSWWQQFLAQRIAVGDVWKTVGDLTMNDLDTVVEVRRAHAAQVLAQADRYEKLGKLLADHGVETVSELPETEVQAVFQ